MNPSGSSLITFHKFHLFISPSNNFGTSYFPLVELIENFPNVGYLICSFLSPRDLLHLSCSNRYLAFSYLGEKSLICQELWRNLCLSVFNENIGSSKTSNRDWKKIFENRFRNSLKKRQSTTDMNDLNTFKKQKYNII